jgi:hypothetical protein
MSLLISEKRIILEHTLSDAVEMLYEKEKEKGIDPYPLPSVQNSMRWFFDIALGFFIGTLISYFAMIGVFYITVIFL